jgi:hypothetical protein
MNPIVGHHPLMVKTYSAADIKVGRTITVERHPIYASNDAPAYRVSTKTIREAVEGVDYHGDPFVRVRFTGSKWPFRFTEAGQSFRGGKTGMMHYVIAE